MQQNSQIRTATSDSSVFASDYHNTRADGIHNFRTDDEHITFPQTVPKCTNHDNQTDLRFTKRGLHIANLNIRHLKPKLGAWVPLGAWEGLRYFIVALPEPSI